MKKIQINIGDPQPLPCAHCKVAHGYQYSDYISVHYTSFHENNGGYEGGEYSTGCKTLNKGNSAYCCNCGKKLSFKLIR